VTEATWNLGIGPWGYQKGLHDLGNDSWAWLQPDGGWGWSNAGLIVDSGESLLVDTLFDLPRTQEMLDAMRAAVPASQQIGQLVNTHSNGDHTHGNELVVGAEIIASSACAAEMEVARPERLAMMMKMAREQGGEVGEYLIECFGEFDFEGIRHTPPSRTFDSQLSLQVGNKSVELTLVGPAHTAGDILVHVPEDKTVFSGDILFVEGTPILWAGPVKTWIEACDRLLAMDVETIVPGHGPITDKRGPRAIKAYLEYIEHETRSRYEAGMGVVEATRDIALGDFSSWGDAERIAVNVDSLYRELDQACGRPVERTDVGELFARMAAVKRAQR
jgi:glyoxylase-like metal-dependent hydrolase (beta-lactamase superfamily II)